MALIEFKNKPDLSTPINADNLNNNFNELDDRSTEIDDKIGNLSDLATINKANAVIAINEVLNASVDSYNLGSNGYIRFKNGLQLAWLKKNVTAGGTLWTNNTYYSDHDMGSWSASFTELFFAIPTVDNNVFWASCINSSNSVGGSVRCFRPNNGTMNVNVSIIGVGKWK